MGLLALSLPLAWISSGFRGVPGLAPFLGTLLAAAFVLWGGWLLIAQEQPPRWLAGVLILAAVMRLALGALWFVVLPGGGYNNDAERSGYVMADAQLRDQTAWQIAESRQSLIRAFTGYHKADQYGGLLFLSALVYRYLGGSVHQPLQMVVITATFSALAVLFTWALARRAWGEGSAGWAALALALYPEAALLGSSQMREAFFITLAAAAFYGLIRYWQDRSWPGLAWILGALLISLPFSPPSAALLLLLLAVQVLVMGRGLFLRDILRQRRFWIIAGIVVLVVFAGLWISLRQFGRADMNNPLALIHYWLQKSAEWQQHLTERASGWIQKIFDIVPRWMDVPLLLIYGIIRPFLPAALIDITTVPVWYGIAIWRAIGWTLLLPLLLYAPLRAFRKNQESVNGGLAIARGLCVVVWLGILIASFRAGGDEWDNVRYRVAFAGLQVALAAWVLVEQRHSPDPWLRRILVGTALVLAWFTPWYLRRYLHIPWPVAEFFPTLALGLASAGLYWIWDMKKKR